MSKHRQCQQPLARYHKLFTQQETNFIDPTQSHAETLKQELRQVPQEQQLCQGAANTWAGFHTGGLPFPGQDWSAGSTRVTLEQAPAGCLLHPEYHLLRLNSSSGKEKTHPISPTIFFSSLICLKKLKKSHVKHIQGLKVMMKATALQRMEIYIYIEIDIDICMYVYIIHTHT